jgi:hypothetical protein
MAQTVREYVDFFSWNEDIEETNHVRYIYGGDLVIIRHFTKGNNWEIIQTTDSTFSYFQYDSTLINSWINGSLITNKDFFTIDTFITFHLETFDSIPVYRKRLQLIKHGYWKEKKDSLFYVGNYENNVRVGEWYIYNFNDDGDYRKWIYEDGKIISKHQRNIMKTLPKDSIKQRLIGEWYGFTLTDISKIKSINLNKFDFREVMLVRNDEEPTSENRKWKVWWIDDELNLRTMAYHQLRKYRIIYFLEKGQLKLEEVPWD